MSVRLLAFTAAALCASTAAAVDLGRPLSATVKVYGSGGLRGLPAYAAGLLVGDSGHVVTVRSHVLDADPIGVVLDDGRRFDASVVGVSDRHDLALLKCETGGSTLPGYGFEEFGPVPTAGTPLWALGNMYRIAAGDESVSVQRVSAAYVGPLAARRGRYEAELPREVLLLDAVTNNPGALGGPVFDAVGRPVGLIGRELRHAGTNAWVNYAIPLGPAIYDLDRIIGGEDDVDPVPADRDAGDEVGVDLGSFGLRMLPNVVRRTPAFVASVAAGSAAEAAGLRADDLVVAVDGRTTTTTTEVRAALGRVPPDQAVAIAVRRGERLVTVTLDPERGTGR